MITHSFSQDSLFDAVLMKLMISTVYIWKFEILAQMNTGFVFWQQEWDKEIVSACQVAGTKPTTIMDSLWPMLTWTREVGTKGRTAKQKEVQPMVGGMGSLTLERADSGGWGALTTELIPGLSFLQMPHSITFIFFSPCNLPGIPFSFSFCLLSKYRSPSEGWMENIRLIKVFRIINCRWAHEQVDPPFQI